MTIRQSSVRAVTIRNLPVETHRALRARAIRHGRSTEAEIRDILETAVRPAERVNLGTLLRSIALEAGPLTEEELALFERDKTPAEPLEFE
ncbi:MAG: plasmid stability protein [Acidobacteriaceae bacterium]|nr:plasmid stability protein [Acidobacteriaceae bacterium]